MQTPAPASMIGTVVSHGDESEIAGLWRREANTWNGRGALLILGGIFVGYIGGVFLPWPSVRVAVFVVAGGIFVLGVVFYALGERADWKAMHARVDDALRRERERVEPEHQHADEGDW